MLRPRARDLGIRIGRHHSGAYNAITDVAGVQVGHSTIIEGEGRLKAGTGPIRTGVTAILPNAGNIFNERVHGGAFVLNGAGEVGGLTQVVEWGLIETPIALTNTLSVGSVSEAIVAYMVEHYPGIGGEHDVIIPLVGECDDSWLNDIAGHHVRRHHVFEAIAAAHSGPVQEGSVGGGTGMMTCDLKAGIGTSSRVLTLEEGAFTIGVLVQSNWGSLEELRVDGIPVGRRLGEMMPRLQRRPGIAGSIIAVAATDAPLLPHQLNRVAKRVALGIGRMGSYAAHGSGEIVLAFSTANTVPRRPRHKLYRLRILGDAFVNPLYEAALDATEEAILNALLAAEDMTGANHRVASALPVELLMRCLEIPYS
ncbi:MAG: P1 family peptidase [Vulcanimicrobiota bacterium]